jgi:lipoprotein NlpD
MFRVVFSAGILILVLELTGCSVFLPVRTERVLYYPVEQGDTVTALAQRFGISVEDIEEYNDIDIHHIEVGQILRFPVPEQGTPKGRRPKETSLSDLGKGSPSLEEIQLREAGDYVGQLQWPVESRSLSSRFGWRWLKFHEGIDIRAPKGTPIVAAHDGLVVYSGNGIRGYGNLVAIQSAGILSVYAHNDRNRVRRGERVRKGQGIAEVGATGKATGPHLHFETRIRDKNGAHAAVDPLVFFGGNPPRSR